MQPAKKQTQFQSPHRRSEFIPTRRQHAGNRTQFQAHPPRTTQPTIKMQNKPNFQKPEMNLTSYEHRDYDHESPLRTPKKQTQSCSKAKIRPRRIHAGPPANLRRRRNKINQTCFRFFKSPQKPHVSLGLSHYFSHFLIISRVFARFPHQSARLCRSAPQSARTCVFVSIFFWRTPRNCPKTNLQNPPVKKFSLHFPLWHEAK